MGSASLDANSLPFQCDTFTSPGAVTDENIMFQGGVTPIGSALAGPHQRQLPLNRQVVDFG
jgi:hypothetical protein